MNFLIAQIVGIITTIIAIACVQFKNKTFILIGQFISNLLVATSCFLLGGFSGAWICTIAAVQTLFLFFVNQRGPEAALKGRLIIFIVFNIIYILGTIFTYKNWLDIIVLICAILFNTSMVQENSSRMRSVITGSLLLWIIYDFFIGAYTNIITHGMALISTITAKIRLDRKKGLN